MSKIVFNVPDMTCGHCEATVKKTLGALAGVQKVDVDLGTKKVEVEYEEDVVESARLAAALAEQDFPPVVAS